MKELNVRRLALTYAGSFLGAGFVSGQEIWEFFGAFGNGGWAGLLLTILLLTALGIIIILLADRTGILEMDRIMVPWELPWLRRLSAVLQIIFYFGIIAIMYAGGGALISQLFDLPAPLGSAAMCIFVTIVAIYGASGIVEVYSLLVPLMVLLAVCTGIGGILHFGISSAQTTDGGNPLLGGWLLGCITYTAYNSFATVGILLPVAEIPHTDTVARHGIIFGSILLFAVAGSVLGGMASCPGASESELPMLYLASALSVALGYAYGVLLLLAMYGSALSCVVAVTSYAYQKKSSFRERRVPLLIALGLVCFAASLGGFGDLISILYPLFGYASIVFLVCLVWHFIEIQKKKEA